MGAVIKGFQNNNAPNREILLILGYRKIISNAIGTSRPSVAAIAINVPTAKPKAISCGDFFTLITFLKCFFKFFFIFFSIISPQNWKI